MKNIKFSYFSSFVFATVLLSAGLAHGKGPVKVIFDSDMIGDFDDVGALACLHALADAGEAEILATVSSTRGNASVGAIQVINTYYGRGDLPVGAPKGMGVNGVDPDVQVKVEKSLPPDPKRDRGHYKYRKLLTQYPGWYTYADADDSPDANETYRKVLATAPDGSVVICSTGFLTNLRRLLETGPDAHSPLTGRELVRRKVRKWVAMACKYPYGYEYNSRFDAESSRIALSEWPTPVVISDFEYGVDVFAGRAIAEASVERSPVKDIFKGNIPTRDEIRADPARQLRASFGMGGRSAWDETAVLAAVRGETAYFNTDRGTYRMIGTDGKNEWAPDAEGGRHLRLTERLSKAEVGRIIDELMLRPPRKGRAALASRSGGAFAGFEKPDDMPGAVSMIWTGKEVLADVSGYADLATKRPISTNDLFWIASNTKAIACALMLLQIDKGLVRLDAPVADYLPEWKDIRIKCGKAPKHAPTVREVMGHTAGLAFFPKMPITQFSVQQLAHMAVTNGLDHDVGEYLYSNWGIDVAMAVVERVTGKPWEKSLQAEVLDPLGMKDTTFFPTVKDYETRMAKSYRLDPHDPKNIPGEMYVDQLVFPYDKPGTHAEAGGGLFATASDLLAFFRMVASRGKLPDGRQFISEKLMDEWYGLTDFYKGKKYTFGMDADAKRGFVRHGGAYNTDGAANWRRGSARVFMTQIAMWTTRSVERRRNWEDYAAQWLDVGADREEKN